MTKIARKTKGKNDVSLAAMPEVTTSEAWTEMVQDLPKINPADDAQHEADSAHMGADLSPIADGAENLMDEAPAPTPHVTVTMEGHIKGGYAYSKEAFQGKTRWFDTSKVDVVEADGKLTVVMTAKEAKKRGIAA